MPDTSGADKPIGENILKTRILLAGAVLIATTSAALAEPSMTLPQGQSLPFDNRQPSLVVTQALPLAGFYPSRDGGSAMGDTWGFVYSFAGNYAPGSSRSADGSLLSIQQNQALFSLLGTTWGGDGRSNFALPNLSGRAIIGQGSTPGLTTRHPGDATGQISTTLTVAQLPSHTHALPGGGSTGATGGGQPFSNMMPSLPMHTLIAANGAVPAPAANGGTLDAAFVGQIATFAGTFTPGGWLEADGSLLAISQYDALFSVIGTTYGGDGQNTFALPNLTGRVAVGRTANHPLGSAWGEESTTLTLAQMSQHGHQLTNGGSALSAGGTTPVSNDQPSLAVSYLIATEGVYPGREGGAGFDTDVPVLGQLTAFAGSFAPRGWTFADGQLMSIAQNQALFSILGTQYGGDGVRTFALPDLRGRTLIGADGSSLQVGEVVGEDAFYLGASLPAHVHTVSSVPEPAPAALLAAGLALVMLRRRRT